MVYDLIVLGGGPAGYNAAEKAAHAGLKTMVCEKRFYGGVCLNEGCVPTKSYLYSAKLKDGAMHGDEYGINLPKIVYDLFKMNCVDRLTLKPGTRKLKNGNYYYDTHKYENKHLAGTYVLHKTRQGLTEVFWLLNIHSAAHRAAASS